jgi:hypothetical protein
MAEKTMNGQWSQERIWEWYNARPWIRGCNFMGSDVVNWLDMWQEQGFEEKLKTAEEEIALAAKTGFNAIRTLLDYVVWREQHDGFLERLDRFLNVIYKYGIRAVLVLGNDCSVPRDNPYSQLRPGEQKFDWGYHGGRKNSQHSTLNKKPGYWLIDDEPERVYEWVREIITRYKDDDRVLIWDLYNEPGSGMRDEITKPHIQRFFEIAREVDPIQPVTAGAWCIREVDEPLRWVEQFALDNSDIISYHSYALYSSNVQVIRKLKKYGRPIICTEWLARTLHNTVQEMYPLFYVEKIGCFNWGLVAGKYQTYEPWNTIWEQYDRGQYYNEDFTKWFHDLYRPNHRPYDPFEIELMQTLAKAADKEFQLDHKEKD